MTSQQLGRQAARRSVLDAQAVLRKNVPEVTAVAGSGVLPSNPSDSSRRIASVREMGGGNHRLDLRRRTCLRPSVRDAESIRQDRVSEWWAIPARTQIKFRSDAAKWRGDMDDMVAFITGGGSGIGQAAAKLLARRGARVSLAGRTQDQLAEVAEAIGGAGGTAITVTCDVSDEDSVRPAAASGQLPFVITNIGPNLLTLTGTVSGEVNPTVPQWSSRTIVSNGTILYFT